MMSTQKMSAPMETKPYIPQMRISLTPDWCLSLFSEILTCLKFGHHHVFLHSSHFSIRRPNICQRAPWAMDRIQWTTNNK